MSVRFGPDGALYVVDFGVMTIANEPQPRLGTDFLVRLQLRNGFGEMPAFGPEEIDAEELDALLGYLRELRRYRALSSG